jgi:hypothetical protein
MQSASASPPLGVTLDEQNRDQIHIKYVLLPSTQLLLRF